VPEKHMSEIADGSIYSKYEALKELLKTEMDNWEQLHSELEEMKNG